MHLPFISEFDQSSGGMPSCYQQACNILVKQLVSVWSNALINKADYNNLRLMC